MTTIASPLAASSSWTTRLTAAQRRALIAASIGNAVEWVDWAVYSAFAPIFEFFPSADRTAALLSALAVFAVGFIMRPIGGAVLGAYADRHGLADLERAPGPGLALRGGGRTDRRAGVYDDARNARP